ncbi:MAG: zinc-dependent peptidase [Actinomycetota bacterium]
MFRNRPGLPDDWATVVAGNVGSWALLDAGERETVAADADWLLRHKHWEAAHGFALTDEMRATVAVLAAIPVIGLTVEAYREVSAVVVFPTTIQSQGERAGPVEGTVSDDVVPVLGEAHGRRGPVLLAWDQVLDDARHPGQGRNVVFHEFAHKLDLLDHVVDGTPPLAGRRDLDRWIAVCTEVYDAMRAGADRPPLDPYGATNPGEFFAVATEAFLDVPRALVRHEPDLYAVLQDYFRQDPATRGRVT